MDKGFCVTMGWASSAVDGGGTVWEPELDEQARGWQAVARRLTAEAFAPRAAGIDAAQRYPVENVELLAESGIDRLFLPPPHGHGGSLTSLCAVIEAIA